MIVISVIALGVGAIGAFLAVGLLRLISLFTNLFFYLRFSAEEVSPAGTDLGLLVVAVPVLGGLIIGVMARYGSERIRGHGIPEALEAILIGRSRVEPRVAVLKPVSSAISIGSGGPFGAEGPIIMTGGAIGSIIAQLMRLTSAERKTLLVAGAAAGMSATFGSPIAAAALSVELLLFEWKPRSLIPVALASSMAALLRHYLIGPVPLFPTPLHVDFVGPLGLLGCVMAGMLAGGLSALLTGAVYACEDGFHRLPLHWMWWPAIGGFFVGLGGLVFPEALGVGYETIGQLLQGEATTRIVLGVLLVKSGIWVVALGSGTSGGVLAPLLMIGGALGALEAGVLPEEGAGFWPLISMAAILGGTMRAPFTGVIFALELTHDVDALLPLLVAVSVAYGFTVLTLRRSILTEKISRRGLHLGREYAVDPLEILLVHQVLRTELTALPSVASPTQLRAWLDRSYEGDEPTAYPVIAADGELRGMLRRSELQRLLSEGPGDEVDLAAAARRGAVVYPDEPLRLVVYRMAETRETTLPVVERGGGVFLGIISLYDLLTARVRTLREERRRERLLRIHRPLRDLRARSIRRERRLRRPQP
ncbi:MAG: CBS domain-containing protein [Dehalococcoidia bacterium]|nr:CBS domain-containing protein [Dehalococcoidia bacterium]